MRLEFSISDSEAPIINRGREIHEIIREPFELGCFQIGHCLTKILSGERSTTKPHQVAVTLAPHPLVREN